MMKQLYIILILTTSILAQYPGHDPYSHNIMWNDFHPATKDSIRQTASDSVTVIYPIPTDSLVIDSLIVRADSALGGGGWVTLGDSIGLHVNVDSVTIDILADTLRVDTTKLATRTYVTDTLSAYWDTTNVKTIVSDSSQYYYYRAVSHDHYPGYGNMVPWDYGQTNQDSVFICEFVDAATGKNYVEVKADTASSNEHHGYLRFEFTAPRDVSDITSTLFEIEYKMSISDTDSVGIRVKVFEGLTERYTSGTRLASATWTTLTIAKGDSTLSAIEEGDRFSVQVDFKTQAGGTSPTNWISRVRERWW
jgi:hypothetical protein